MINFNYIVYSWYILPYLDAPQDDSEFSVYFTIKWIESLKITLLNFLTIVLSTAPIPKLLLLEKWYRTESQTDIRLKLKQSYNKMNILIEYIEKSEIRLNTLRNVMKELIINLSKTIFNNNNININHSINNNNNNNSNNNTNLNENSNNNSNNNNNSNSNSNSNSNNNNNNNPNSTELRRGTNIALFETDEEQESKKKLMKDLNININKLLNELILKGNNLLTNNSNNSNNSNIDEKLKDILGYQLSNNFFYGNNNNENIDITNNNELKKMNDTTIEELESNLVEQVNLWLKTLSS